MVIALRALVLLVLLAARPALAWWDYGHRTVAAIAEAELTPQARREIARLLARAPLLDTPTCPLKTLKDASVWPDCIKTLGDRFSYAEYWHYQDIPICKPFNIDAECPHGQCVTGQIPRMARLLGDRRVPDRERLQALAFLVHFVGDMHQPLHIADDGDAGGNRVKTTYGYKQPPRMNLHRVWDGELAERAISEPPGGATGLRSEISAADRAAWASGDIEDWARESWLASRDIVYGKLPVARNVCEASPRERIALDERYVAATEGTVRLGIKKAGVRLASLLNTALSGRAPPVPTKPSS